MKDPEWLWSGLHQSPTVATFPHVSAQPQAQLHQVIQAQRKENANICLRLTPEAGLQATSGYPV